MESNKAAWTTPQVTPLTNTGARSDTPDTAARNAAGGPSLT